MIQKNHTVRKLLPTISNVFRKSEIKIALVVVLSLSLIPVEFGRIDWVVGAIADAGHFWFYFTVFLYLRRVQIQPKQLLFGLIVIAGLIELLQPLVKRDGTFQDFIVSALGAICGFVYVQKVSPIIRFGMILCCAMPLLFPIYWRIEVLKFQERNFPVFSIFTDLKWKDLWKPTAPDKDPSSDIYLGKQGELVVKAIATMSFPGVVYMNRFIDWTSYHKLELEIEAYEDEKLTIRIDDDGDCTEYEDRFNRAYLIRKGLNGIQIAFDDIRITQSGRVMDLSKIKRVSIFTDKREKTEDAFAIKSLKLAN